MMIDPSDKVSKLLNDISCKMEIENERKAERTRKNIPLTVDNSNENAILSLANDGKYYLNINKKCLDIELGGEIVEFLENKIKADKEANQGKTNTNPIEARKSSIGLLETKKIKFKSIKLEPKQEGIRNMIHFKTKLVDDKQKVPQQADDFCEINSQNFQTVKDNEKFKHPKYKVSYKSYFNSPRCDICDVLGIPTEELSQYSKQQQIDSIVLDYVLYTCSKCKVCVHKNCATAVLSLLGDVSPFPIISTKEKNHKWTCDTCMKNISSLDCTICRKNEESLKFPHLMTTIEKNALAHAVCYLWWKLFPTQREGVCYICKEEDSRSFIMKCSQENCNFSFHSICIKEKIHYQDIQKIDDHLFAVCMCENHSENYIIKALKSN